MICFRRVWPLYTALRLEGGIIQPADIYAGTGSKAAVFCIYFRSGCIVESMISHFLRKAANDLCVRQGLAGSVGDLMQVADAPFCIRHGAFFFSPGGSREYDIRITQGFRFI